MPCVRSVPVSRTFAEVSKRELKLCELIIVERLGDPSDFLQVVLEPLVCEFRYWSGIKNIQTTRIKRRMNPVLRSWPARSEYCPLRTEELVVRPEVLAVTKLEVNG